MLWERFLRLFVIRREEGREQGRASATCLIHIEGLYSECFRSREREVSVTGGKKILLRDLQYHDAGTLGHSYHVVM